ncbi:preprotein translocase subunit YajC [Kineosporia succinea]|uniref:Preprotein translocase subunit YajC n=1 Tax=Kineosporia succinea TaxID=84632 RepID=A0ABT9NV81_9ACTN|nr:preprotein translocase subunit YajC [Kineosporia succinea]MDP9824338.1 preprotein translocase subunit YajC [Kineosporia succinea]
MELIILAVPLVLLWFMVSRQRKQQRELMAQQDSVAPGTRVMTTSGLYAEVVEVEADAVVLEIAPGLLTRWNKRAIAQIVPETDPAEADGPAETDGTPHQSTTTGTPDATDTTGSTTAERDGIRSEAGYAPPPESGTSDGSTGSDGR